MYTYVHPLDRGTNLYVGHKGMTVVRSKLLHLCTVIFASRLQKVYHSFQVFLKSNPRMASALLAGIGVQRKATNLRVVAKSR